MSRQFDDPPLYVVENGHLRTENARLRAALEFYANVAHYVVGPNDEDSDVEEDSGTRARAALSEGDDNG
jgi:hypothetical protein